MRSRYLICCPFFKCYRHFVIISGAYYYYKTAPDMNYDETLMKVKEYSDGLNIPYR